MNNKTTSVITTPSQVSEEVVGGTPWIGIGLAILVVGFMGYMIWKKFIKKSKEK
jgi:uncharacterized membrane protein YukC